MPGVVWAALLEPWHSYPSSPLSTLRELCPNLGLSSDSGRGTLDREIPFGHTVYKPNIMSVCVSLKVRV